MIQNKHDVIRASSPGEMCFYQTIHLSLVTTCALVFSSRRGKVKGPPALHSSTECEAISWGAIENLTEFGFSGFLSELF